MEYFTFGAEQEDVGTRIDVFLADAMENLSRSGVQKLIEEGHITLNGGRTKANYKLRERDIIDVEVPEVKEVEILPEDIPLDGGASGSRTYERHIGQCVDVSLRRRAERH